MMGQGMRYLKYTLEHAHCTMTCWRLKRCLTKGLTRGTWLSDVKSIQILQDALNQLGFSLPLPLSRLWSNGASKYWCPGLQVWCMRFFSVKTFSLMGTRSWEKVGHFRVCGTGVAGTSNCGVFEIQGIGVCAKSMSRTL